MLKVATVCSGIGSPEVAIRNLGIKHEIVFGCEIDKYARQTYLANFNPNKILENMTKEDYEDEKYYSDICITGIPYKAFPLSIESNPFTFSIIKYFGCWFFTYL